MKNKNLIKINFRAFTLSEILIVVGIIGIIAESTIPTLINNTNQREYISKMKKAYSVLSSAINQIKYENGGTWEDAMANCSTNACYKNVLKTKLSYIKECDIVTTASNVCFPQRGKIKYLNGNWSTNPYSYYLNNDNDKSSAIVLKDGTALDFHLGSKCDGTVSAGYSNRCGWVVVDVNGLQKPNTWGKDIYLFIIFEDTIRPAIPSIVDAYPYDDCGVGANFGMTCSAKYLYQK